MKNIYGYIYWNIGIYVIPCAVVTVAAGIYFHLSILYLLTAAGVVLMFARGLSGIQFLELERIFMQFQEVIRTKSSLLMNSL